MRVSVGTNAKANVCNGGGWDIGLDNIARSLTCIFMQYFMVEVVLVSDSCWQWVVEKTFEQFVALHKTVSQERQCYNPCCNPP